MVAPVFLFSLSLVAAIFVGCCRLSSCALEAVDVEPEDLPSAEESQEADKPLGAVEKDKEIPSTAGLVWDSKQPQHPSSEDGVVDSAHKL